MANERAFAVGPTVSYDKSGWSFVDTDGWSVAQGDRGARIRIRVDGGTGDVDLKDPRHIETLLFKLSLGGGAPPGYVFHDIGFATTVAGRKLKEIPRFSPPCGGGVGAGFTLASDLGSTELLLKLPDRDKRAFFYGFSIVDSTHPGSAPVVFDPKLLSLGDPIVVNPMIYDPGPEGALVTETAGTSQKRRPRPRHARLRLP